MTTTTEQTLQVPKQKKIKKKCHRTKIFYATAQNTLSFFLLTHQPTAEKKIKECFPQRFIPFSVANKLTVYESYIRNLNINR